MATSGRITGSYPASWANYVPYIDWSVTQDVASNKSTMSVTFGMRKTGANSQSYNGYSQTLTIAVSGTTYTRSITFDFRSAGYPTDHDIVTISGISIPHNADGTKSVSISASHPTDTGMGTGTLSGTASLSTIPRASSMTVPASMTMGTAYTFPISRASSGFTHKVSYKFGNSSGTIASSAGTSTSWTPPTSLGSQIPSALSGTVTLTIDTYSGSTKIGTKTYTSTLSVPSYTPSASMTLVVVNDNAVVNGWGVAVKDYSKLRYTITGSTQYGASISGYEAKIEGTAETLNAASGTSKVLTAASGKVTARVKDSRGKWSAWAEQIITVYDYGLPVIRDSHAYRCDEDGAAVSYGSWMSVLCNGEIYTVNGHNTMICRVRHRVNGGTWSDYEELTDNEVTLMDTAMAVDHSYEAELSVVDTLGNSRVIVYQIPTDKVAFNLKRGGNGAAFGKYAEHEKELELAEDWNFRYKGKVLADYIFPVGCIFLSAPSLDPGSLFGGTWEKVNENVLLLLGESGKINRAAINTKSEGVQFAFTGTGSTTSAAASGLAYGPSVTVWKRTA